MWFFQISPLLIKIKYDEINNISKIKSISRIFTKFDEAAKMQEFKQKFQLLIDICKYFRPKFTYHFSLPSHAIIVSLSKLYKWKNKQKKF